MNNHSNCIRFILLQQECYKSFVCKLKDQTFCQKTQKTHHESSRTEQTQKDRPKQKDMSKNLYCDSLFFSAAWSSYYSKQIQCHSCVLKAAVISLMKQTGSFFFPPTENMQRFSKTAVKRSWTSHDTYFSDEKALLTYTTYWYFFSLLTGIGIFLEIFRMTSEVELSLSSMCSW